jgi:hypothetical protein
LVLVIHQTKSGSYYEKPTLNRDCIKKTLLMLGHEKDMVSKWLMD